jgi:transcriptional regulator with XRE-family HTH domain
MSPRRVQLAARRKAAGYSQEGLAHKIGVTVSAVSRWELGTSTPRANLRRPLAAALDLSPPELEHLLFVERQDLSLDGHALPPGLTLFAALEQKARRMEVYQGVCVHPLLQTRAYATVVEGACHDLGADGEKHERVARRLARQEVLFREPDPLDLVCVLDEAAIRRVVGGQEVMAEQIEHLLKLAAMAQIDLRVLPFDVRAVCAAGTFALLTPFGHQRPTIACAETSVGLAYHEGAHALAQHLSLFEHLQSMSLSPAESVELIANLPIS